MATYVIGDVQGCCDELEQLLEQLKLTANDQLWFVGDLVNRGPKSLETLRLIKALGERAVVVLGNHDLHLLALAADSAAPVVDTWLQPVLDASDCATLLDWLRHQPLAHYDATLDTLLVHAGVPLGWSVQDTLSYADEVAVVLQSVASADFLAAMYGSRPGRWSEELTGMDRLRFITNALTRIRYSTTDGELDFEEKLEPGTQPEHLVPWFELPNRATGNTRIAFGHWSTLGLMRSYGVLATDTGCVWGGPLTAVRLDQEAPPVQVHSGQATRF